MDKRIITLKAICLACMIVFVFPVFAACTGDGLLSQEYDRGRQDGYDSGYTQGQQDGYDLGFAEGIDEGYDQGHTEGYYEGYTLCRGDRGY